MTTPTIMLIEDNPGDVGLWLEAFGTVGISPAAVLVAADGPSALILLEQAVSENRLPRLVITDASLPQMSGVELADHLHHHAQFTHLPVVIVTGFVPAAAATCPVWQTWHEKPNDFEALASLARALTVRHLAAAAGAKPTDLHPRA